MTTIGKSTSRGQITLPKKWRKQFSTTLFTMKMLKKKLIIEPIEIEEIQEEEVDLLEEGEEVIWDAKRDNNGKGISPEEFLKLLEEAQNG
jgi:bifunctional DNA-binding transcriptional regulator/antitoxin component of YhaV-PrlF toxin-antitoxin module